MYSAAVGNNHALLGLPGVHGAVQFVVSRRRGSVRLCGEIIVFASRLLPVIRTFIAFPAGVARMNLKKFVIYTFAGSLPWCIGLAYVGQRLGKEWDTNPTLKTLFHRFDFVIGIALVVLVGWWVSRHLRLLRG